MSTKKSVFWLYGSILLACSGLPLAAVAVLYALGSSLIVAVPVALVAVGVPCAVLGARILVRPVAELARGMKRSIDRLNTVGDGTGGARVPKVLSKSHRGAEFSDIEASWRQMATSLLDRYQRLEVIVRIGHTITNQLDYEDALAQILSAVAQVVPYDAAEIIRYDGMTLRVAAWRGGKDMLNTTGRIYEFGEGLTGMIASTKETLWEPVVQPGKYPLRRTLRPMSDMDKALEVMRKSEINSLLGIPLLVADQLIGVLTMVHHQPDHFTQNHKQLLETLASQASVAIHNALAIKQRESALQARIQDLEIRIDEVQKQRQVKALVDSEYFEDLRAQGRSFRRRTRKRGSARSSAPTKKRDES